jgi:hypothetical protein
MLLFGLCTHADKRQYRNRNAPALRLAGGRPFGEESVDADDGDGEERCSGRQQVEQNPA